LETLKINTTLFSIIIFLNKIINLFPYYVTAIFVDLNSYIREGGRGEGERKSLAEFDLIKLPKSANIS